VLNFHAKHQIFNGLNTWLLGAVNKLTKNNRSIAERYGYVNVSDVIIREKITPEIQNAICSCFDKLEQIMRENTYDNHAYMDLEKYL